MFILNKFCRFLCILLIIFTSLFNVFISVPRIYMTYYYWNSENILYSGNENLKLKIRHFGKVDLEEIIVFWI